VKLKKGVISPGKNPAVPTFHFIIPGYQNKVILI